MNTNLNLVNNNSEKKISVVRDAWKELYGQTLVGLSTTSLYGIHSMYNSIPLWKTLGSSSGKIALKPDDST